MWRVLLFSLLITISCSSLCFCLWCTWKGCNTAYSVSKDRRRRRNGSGTPRKRRMGNQSSRVVSIVDASLALCNLETSDIPILLTGLCLITICLTQLFLMTSQCLALFGWVRYRKRLWQTRFGDGVFYTWVFLLETSFGLSFLVLYSHLLSTFSNTAYKLPEWSLCLICTMIVLFLMLFFTVLMVSIEIFGSWLYAWASAIILLSIVYVIGMVYLLHAFVSRVFKVAGNVIDNLNSNQASQDKLINAAVRMTVCVSVSLFSASVEIASVYFWIFWCYYQKCGIKQTHIPAIIRNVDLCINAFCILCTLAKSSDYYDFVFGTLHEKYLRFIFKHGKSLKVHRFSQNALSISEIDIPVSE